MVGIILAGGTGTRLHPLTIATSKHLLAVFDKPLIYYPLSTLMLAGIRKVLIISSPEYTNSYKSLLGNGQDLGIEIQHKVQEKPNGIAEAFIIGKDFIGKDSVALILGDNIFYGPNFTEKLVRSTKMKAGAQIYGYRVTNPNQFGVINFNEFGQVVSIEEKPKKPKSNIIATGLYFYDNQVTNIAQNLLPSNRGELEITDINNFYLEQQNLICEQLGRGFAWFDTGNPDSLLDASTFVQTLEKRQGLKVACIEEIAFQQNWIDKKDLKKLAKKYNKSSYGSYLKNLTVNENN
jgi:glucose-1-phosphate thymidylyltransferase